MTRYSVPIDMRKTGGLPRPDFRRAIREAQRENADLALKRVKQTARLLMKRSGPRTARTRRGASMVDSYMTRFSGDLSFILTNPTQRATWFEVGTKRHKIRARPGSSRGARGRFIKGASYLRWTDPLSGMARYATEVNHPGTTGRFPIRKTMEDLEGAFGRNIDEKIAAEMERS